MLKEITWEIYEHLNVVLIEIIDNFLPMFDTICDPSNFREYKVTTPYKITPNNITFTILPTIVHLLRDFFLP